MKLKELLDVMCDIDYHINEIDYENNCKNRDELLELTVCSVRYNGRADSVVIDVSKYSKKQAAINHKKREIQELEQRKALINGEIEDIEKEIEDLANDD